MKPVDQTRFGNPGGNCFQAALASILELPLESVPDFCNQNWHGDWVSNVNEWLYKRGLFSIAVDAVLGDTTELERISDNCWCLASVPSANFSKTLHSVVWHKNKVVHDPHPSKAHMNAQPTQLTFFVVCDPALVYMASPALSPC